MCFTQGFCHEPSGKAETAKLAKAQFRQEADECLSAFMKDLKGLMLPCVNQILATYASAEHVRLGWDQGSLKADLREGMKSAKLLVEVLRKDLHDGVMDSFVAQPPAWTCGGALWNLLPKG